VSPGSRSQRYNCLPRDWGDQDDPATQRRCGAYVICRTALSTSTLANRPARPVRAANARLCDSQRGGRRGRPPLRRNLCDSAGAATPCTRQAHLASCAAFPVAGFARIVPRQRPSSRRGNIPHCRRCGDVYSFCISGFCGQRSFLPACSVSTCAQRLLRTGNQAGADRGARRPAQCRPRSRGLVAAIFDILRSSVRAKA